MIAPAVAAAAAAGLGIAALALRNPQPTVPRKPLTLRAVTSSIGCPARQRLAAVYELPDGGGKALGCATLGPVLAIWRTVPRIDSDSSADGTDIVTLHLNADQAKELQQIAAHNVDRQIAFVLDRRVIAAPLSGGSPALGSTLSITGVSPSDADALRIAVTRS